MATASLEIIMEDDMQPGSTLLEPSDLRMLSELSGYRIDRKRAELWAHRDIKFLVYDDTDLQQNGYDSDDEEGMVEFAMMISGGSDLTSEDEGGGSEERDNEEITWGRPTSSKSPPDADRIHEDEEGMSEDEEVMSEEQECSFCLSIPEFPRNFKPRKFRLVQATNMVSHPDEFKPGGPYVCSHYVAVSYCWPVPQVDEHGKAIMAPGSYRVRDLDGIVRTSRVMDDVLDRAVDFAASCGVHMIWIDQECLPQPKEDSPQEYKDEQELGVQAMDVVYNRACITAGLLSVSIASQEQMNAIATLRAFSLIDFGTDATWEGVGPAPPVTDISRMLNHVLDFLENTSADRWYTRAWVAQEGLSAGEMLILTFHINPDVSYTDLLENGEPDDNPYIARIPPKNGIPSSTIGISVKGFQHLVRVAKCLFYIIYTRPGETLHPRAWLIIQKAETLHPTAPQPKILSERMFIPGGNNYRPRQTTDAAGALTLLQTRGCRDVQDRIAIVANMCNFENRLSTYLLGRHCRSLRLALIALTVLNGDYSLLVPEAYQIRTHQDSSQRNDSTIGWSWPLNLAANDYKLHYYRLRHEGFLSSSTYNFGETFTPNGPRLNAHLWTIEDTIDFTLIQREWADKWNDLRPLEVFVKRGEGESAEEVQERQRGVVQGLAKDLEILQQVRSIALSGSHMFKAGTGYSDVDFEASIRNRPNVTPATHRGVAEIVFAILRHLYLDSHSDRQAIGLANSIWHSLRVDAVSTDADELPDDVGDWLFSHPDIDDDPSVLLQLDETPDESFGQAWFIERIMRDGYLWVGRYIIPESFKDSSSDDTKGKGLADESSKSQTSDPDEIGTILTRQMTRKMITSMAIIAGSGEPDTDRAEGVAMNMDRRNLVSFVGAISHKLREKQQHEACARDLVSAFDVDGPCLVAIPRNNDLEVLPRPPLRSMAVCWVVEPVIGEKETDRSGPPNFHASTGKDKFGVHDDDSRGSTSQQEISSERVRTSSQESNLIHDNNQRLDDPEETHEISYRVMNKVRGFWMIKEYPMFRYKFM